MSEHKDSAWEAFVENLKSTNFKLPHQRIWNIMKSDEDVRMISQETTVLMTKACEMFIFDLTHRAWQIAAENDRKTITHDDIMEAIQRDESFDFLRDLPPPNPKVNQALNSASAAATASAAAVFNPMGVPTSDQMTKSQDTLTPYSSARAPGQGPSNM